MKRLLCIATLLLLGSVCYLVGVVELLLLVLGGKLALRLGQRVPIAN